MYVGYPISFTTACFLFHLPPETTTDTMLHAHLTTYGITFTFYDKNVWILGLQVKEFYIGDTYISVNEAFEILMYYKKKVVDALTAARARMAEFDIEIMEGDPLRVYNPQPYVID